MQNLSIEIEAIPFQKHQMPVPFEPIIESMDEPIDEDDSDDDDTADDVHY
jgi:hypothetical protein